MKLVFSRRALADLEDIATYYATNASPAVAQSIKQRFLAVSSAFVLRRNLHPASDSARRCALPRSCAIHSESSIACAAIRSISCIFGTHQGGRRVQGEIIPGAPANFSNFAVRRAARRFPSPRNHLAHSAFQALAIFCAAERALSRGAVVWGKITGKSVTRMKSFLFFLIGCDRVQLSSSVIT